MSHSDRQLIDAIKRGLGDRLADNKELIATGPGGIPEAVLAQALAAGDRDVPVPPHPLQA